MESPDSPGLNRVLPCNGVHYARQGDGTSDLSAQKNSSQGEGVIVGQGTFTDEFPVLLTELANRLSDARSGD